MIEQALIISLIVLFLHITTTEGHIFEGIKKLVPPEGKLYKPLYGCPICMTPWWGSAIYWIFFHVGLSDWLLSVGAAAGLNTLYTTFLALKGAAVEVKKDLEHEQK